MKVNKNLCDAINSFNRLTLPRAEIVIQRIFSKPGSSHKELFTNDEIMKFERSQQLSEAQLSNIVNGFSFVLLHIVAERNLTQVEEVLLQNGLQHEHLEVFKNAWLQFGNDYSVKIREKPIAVRDILHSFNWNISLQVDESRLPMKNAANFLNVEGKIDKADDLYSYDARNPVTNFIFETQCGESMEKFSIKFQKQQMQELFEQLETIQESLDKLM